MTRVMPADDNAKEEEEEELEKNVRLFLEEEQAKDVKPLPHKMGGATLLERDPGSIAPNPDIARFRPPSRFSLSGPLVHIFISYRAESEKDESDQLYDAVINLYKESYPIPPGARGKPCPLTAAPRSAPHVCKVFLDRHCLLDGRDWEAGFVLALAHSIVAVPLLSWSEDDTGSVGQMVSLQGETDHEDNVLLEFMLMIALKSHAESSVQAIYPVLMGARNADGSFAEFPFAELQRLPGTPSAATSSRAAKIMHMLGLPSDLIHEMRVRSVRDTIYTILRSQGCKLSTLDVSSAWQDQCGSKLVSLLLREVRILLDSPSTLSATRPCAEELFLWLQKCRLHQLIPVFNNSGLSSLEAVATISGGRVRELCRLYAQSRTLESFKLDEDLYARFEVMRNRLKSSDLRSRSMKVRLDRFVDNKVSWAAAFSSTSAVEIAASSWIVQPFAGVVSCFFFLIATSYLKPQLHWRDYLRGLQRLGLGVGGGAFVLVGYFLKRPLRGKNMLQCAFLLASAAFAVRPVVALAQSYFGSHDDPQLSFTLYLINTQTHIFWSQFFVDLMWFVVLFGLWLALRRRQEVFVLWACAGLAVLGADECLKQAAFGVFRVGDLLIFVPFVVWTAFVLFVRYHTKSSMSQAKRTVSSNAHKLNNIWAAEQDRYRDQGSGTHAALQLLGDKTLRIEETLDAARRQAMSRAWACSRGMWLQSMVRLPQEGLAGSKGRYSLTGKVRQRCSDIVDLFTRATIINDVFQDHFQNIVNGLNARRREAGASAKSEEEERRGDLVMLRGPVKKPERALQKCVRVYRRDTACLTDLVRCTIVAQTIQQVHELLSAIISMSVVHTRVEDGAGRSGGEEKRQQTTCATYLPRQHTTRDVLAAAAHHLHDIESGVTDDTKTPIPFAPARQRRSGAMVLAAGESAGGCGSRGRSVTAPRAAGEEDDVTDETRLLQQKEAREWLFRITACKDRFREGSKHFNSETGFRNVSLNLEVGFVFQVDEHDCRCVLVPESDALTWQAQGADTLICELQIHLAPLLYMQENPLAHPTHTTLAHPEYVVYRDLAAR